MRVNKIKSELCEQQGNISTELADKNEKNGGDENSL